MNPCDHDGDPREEPTLSEVDAMAQELDALRRRAITPLLLAQLHRHEEALRCAEYAEEALVKARRSGTYTAALVVELETGQFRAREALRKADEGVRQSFGCWLDSVRQRQAPVAPSVEEGAP